MPLCEVPFSRYLTWLADEKARPVGKGWTPDEWREGVAACCVGEETGGGVAVSAFAPKASATAKPRGGWNEVWGETTLMLRQCPAPRCERVAREREPRRFVYERWNREART